MPIRDRSPGKGVGREREDYHSLSAKMKSVGCRDHQLWGETYERDLDDVLKLQNELTLAIVHKFGRNSVSNTTITTNLIRR